MVSSASFIKSLSSFEDYEKSGIEIVFLGRSNVGKSSLINSLCNNKKLAKSSSTPGKTRLINLFDVRIKDDENLHNFIFIDMPGFGYARVSKALKRIWDKNLDEFLKLRKNIKLFIHLIDARHSDLELDDFVRKYLLSLMNERQNLLTVFTKADKLNQSELHHLKSKAQEDFLLVSNTKKTGLKDLENKILQLTLE